MRRCEIDQRYHIPQSVSQSVSESFSHFSKLKQCKVEPGCVGSPCCLLKEEADACVCLPGEGDLEVKIGTLSKFWH